MEEYDTAVKERLPWRTCADPDCEDCGEYYPAVNTIRPIIDIFEDYHDDEFYCDFCGRLADRPVKKLDYGSYIIEYPIGYVYISRPFLCGLPPV